MWHVMGTLQTELDLSAFSELVNVFGTPLAILVILGLAVVRTAKWIAPRVDRIVDRQIAFIDSVDNRLDAFTGALTGLTREVRELRELMEKK